MRQLAHVTIPLVVVAAACTTGGAPSTEELPAITGVRVGSDGRFWVRRMGDLAI